MDRILRYFGIARKAGYLELGEEDTGAAVRAGKAKVVLLAADASDNAKSRAEGFVHGRNTLLLRVPCSKEEISAATGKGGCSMAAVTDIGLAESMVAALAETDSAAYGAAAQELEARRRKAMQRRAEADAHARNRKTGKRRTAL